MLHLLQLTGDWQKFKGLPGAENKVRLAQPKPDKQTLFAAALAAAGEEPTVEATTPRKRGAKKADTAEAKADADTAAESADTK